MRRETPQKKINYASIAISGLLRHYSPKRATVTVDGVEHVFEKAWLAPTMFGKYYGGGMMATPNQDRNAKEQTISVLLFHGAGRIKTLSIFPSIFKGEHVKHKKQVAILTGKEIHVRFDQPASVQIDGETITDVTEYSASVHSTVLAKAK
jgi:diacylglycerol kinase family enzyme